MISKKLIMEALERTKDDVRKCQVAAHPGYANQLLGHVYALQFVLGFSRIENYKACKELRLESPYWIDKLRALEISIPIKEAKQG